MKQRLYPEGDQVEWLWKHASDARFIYNLGLEQRSMWTEQRRHFKQKVTLKSQTRELTDLRADVDWVREGSVSVQQAALRDLDRAFSNFFGGTARFPSFKRRGSDASFVIRDIRLQRLNKKWALVTIPKAGRVKFRLTRSWADVSAASSARVKRRNGVWTISFTTPAPARRQAPAGSVVGIDVGVANTVTTSDGEFYRIPDLSPAQFTRQVHLQRRLARQTPGSARRQQTLDALAVLRRKRESRRTDFIEQTTTALARRFETVGVEALRVAQMVKRVPARPDPESPGDFLANGQAAKSGLNRAIHDGAWGKFRVRLGDKTEIVPVNPIGTSQECNQCRFRSPDNRESQAVFVCVRCGHRANADVNAALNIRDAALRLKNPGTRGDRARQSPRSSVNQLVDDKASANNLGHSAPGDANHDPLCL